MTEPTMTIESVLRQCAEQFRFYEREHLAKGTKESILKAQINGDMATLCELVLPTEPTKTLRDEFAMSVITGICANPGTSGAAPSMIPAIAKIAYELADAMIQAR